MPAVNYKNILRPPEFQPYMWQQQARMGIQNSARSCVVVSRQHGKTELAIDDCIEFCITTKRKNPIVAIIGPSITQTEKIYWNRFLAKFSNAFKAKYVNDVKSPTPTITIRRPYYDYTDSDGNRIEDVCTIYLFGAENGKAIEGQALDYALIDELGLWPLGVLKTSVEPALTKKKGLMRIYGTPRGDNDLYTALLSYSDSMLEGKEKYFALHKNVHELKVLEPEEIEEIRLDYEKQGKLHQYDMAYMVNFFANVEGAVFARGLAEARAKQRIMEGLTMYEYLPVFTVWDIGLSFTSCWAFQFVNGRYHMISHWEWEDKSLKEIIPEVRDSGYNFSSHFLPHDAYQRSRVDKKTYAESFTEEMNNNGYAVKIPKIDKEEIRTSTAKRMFYTVNFSKDGCKKGLDLLAQYKVQFDKNTGYLKTKVIKDRYSHTGDAFCQMFMIPKNQLIATNYQQALNRAGPFVPPEKKGNYKPGTISMYGNMHLHKKRGF